MFGICNALFDFLSLDIVLIALKVFMYPLSFIRPSRHWTEVEFVMNIGTLGPTLGLKGRFHKLTKPM